MVGMVAIHTLPELNEKTGRPTMNWNLFSGHASALFAVLAGVTISLLSGGNNPHTGDRMQQTRIMLGTRALVLLLFGLTLNFMDFSAHNILLYYGLYFLLVIPFTTMTSGQLFVMGGFCAIFGPLAIQATRLVTVIDPSPNPSLEQAISDPIGTVLALFALGTYPAFTWLTFIFIGMGIGRLQLTREKTQTKLVFYGLTIALTSSIASQMLLYQFGGLEAIQRANASMSGDNIQSIIDFGGGNDQLETTMWWLVIPTPHSNTTFSVLISGGIAIALIGVFLMLGKQKVVPLALLADIGSMTLTLFTLHLTFLSIVDVDAKPVLWFITQIGVAISIAAIWKRIWKRGPLEYIVTTVCGNTARILQPKVASLLRRGGASGDEAQREGLDGADSESDADLEDSEEDRPGEGDSEDHSDLAEGGQGSRRRTRVLGGHRLEGDGRERHDEGHHPGARQRQRGGEVPARQGLPIGRDRPQDPDQRARLHHASGQHGPFPHPLRREDRQWRGHHGAQCEGQERELCRQS